MSDPVRVGAEAKADLTPPATRAVWLPLVLLAFGGAVMWAGGRMALSDGWRSPVMIMGCISMGAGVLLALWGGIRGKDPEKTERRVDARTCDVSVSILAIGGDAGDDALAIATKILMALRRDYRRIEPRASGLFGPGETPVGRGAPLSPEAAEHLREQDIAAAETSQALLRENLRSASPRLLEAMESPQAAPDAGQVGEVSVRLE